MFNFGEPVFQHEVALSTPPPTQSRCCLTLEIVWELAFQYNVAISHFSLIKLDYNILYNHSLHYPVIVPNSLFYGVLGTM